LSCAIFLPVFTAKIPEYKIPSRFLLRKLNYD